MVRTRGRREGRGRRRERERERRRERERERVEESGRPADLTEGAQRCGIVRVHSCGVVEASFGRGEGA